LQGKPVLEAAVPFFLTADFWDSAIRVTGPIALAAVAATLCSRAGILFIGIEGVMLVSAFFSIAGAIWTHSVWLGVMVAVGSGITASLVFGLLAITLRMGDVVAGLVVDVGALGLMGFFHDQWFPNGATIGAQSLEPLWGSFAGGVGRVLFHQQPLVYVALCAAILLELFLRTRWGLVVRSSGESTRVARSFGIDLVRLRFLVLAVAGAIVGLGGATIGLAIVGTFDVNVVSGRGFIGLACVMLGGWRPVGAVLAALLFGIAYALQFRVTAIGGWAQLFPYVLTLVALATLWGRSQGPAEEGRGLDEDSR
jgi:general nucleoside transport system permease protein